jgi:hypothetical protein
MAEAGVMEGMPEDFFANLRNRPGSVAWFLERKVVKEEEVGKVWVGRSMGVLGLGGIDRAVGRDIVLVMQTMWM